MKRQVAAAMLALTMTTLAALPASASAWFDWSVFQQVEGIRLTGEDAAGEAYADQRRGGHRPGDAGGGLQ